MHSTELNPKSDRCRFKNCVYRNGALRVSDKCEGFHGTAAEHGKFTSAPPHPNWSKKKQIRKLMV